MATEDISEVFETTGKKSALLLTGMRYIRHSQH